MPSLWIKLKTLKFFFIILYKALLGFLNTCSLLDFPMILCFKDWFYEETMLSPCLSVQSFLSSTLGASKHGLLHTDCL